MSATTTARPKVVTRTNVDQLLDHRLLEVRMRDKPDGTQVWWSVRRNGQTRLGVRYPNRISIPLKAGLKTYGKITEADFDENGVLDPAQYRVKRD